MNAPPKITLNLNYASISFVIGLTYNLKGIYKKKKHMSESNIHKDLIKMN